MCWRVISKVGVLMMLFSTTTEDGVAQSEHGGSEDVPPVEDDKGVQELNDLLTKRVSDWGFHLKTYEVTTEDNYMLKIHRTFKNEKNLKSPMLIMHGITGCSANYLANRNSLAYYLAEKGYDVWVGNARGNAFSIKHKDMVNMNPDKNGKYWDFSFHEKGYFDVPAFFKKIKKETGAERVHYIGFSMGTTMFLVMASTRHSLVRDDVASVTLMAPVACPKHFDTIKSKTNTAVIKMFLKLVRVLGRGDIYTHHKSIASALYTACSSRGWTGKLCEKYLRSKSIGKDTFDFGSSLEAFMFFPCGTSVKAYQHFIQIAEAGEFRQYDYGEKENKAKYNQHPPPDYDLRSIDKKMYLLVGGQDNLADKRDIKWLHERLPEGKGVYISKRFEDFDHRDFEYGVEMPVIHETVFEIIEAHDEGREPNIEVESFEDDQTADSH